MAKTRRDVSSRTRVLLDEQFKDWQGLRSLRRPPRGWLRSIRDALGLSTAALAARLGVSATAVTRMEQSEVHDRIQLGTLRRAADALECDLVYVLVPRRPLSEVVHEQALMTARRHAAAVHHTMRLEDQATPIEEASLNRLADELVATGKQWSRW